MERWQRVITSEGGVSFAGVPIVKAPTDFLTLQMLVCKLRPDVIIEIGNWYGGMLLAYASWLDAIGAPSTSVVIGIDITHDAVPGIVRNHRRVGLWRGDAADLGKKAIADLVLLRRDLFTARPILIVEDSSHEYDQCLDVLRTFAPLASAGSYFVVEDTVCGHGLDVGPRPGPHEAVETFLAESPEWERDETLEVFGLTWNPGGYLRRLA
jgi:cephalosporin hydroxylase